MSRTLPALSLAVQPRIVNALLAAGLALSLGLGVSIELLADILDDDWLFGLYGALSTTHTQNLLQWYLVGLYAGAAVAAGLLGARGEAKAANTLLWKLAAGLALFLAVEEFSGFGSGLLDLNRRSFRLEWLEHVLLVRPIAAIVCITAICLVLVSLTVPACRVVRAWAKLAEPGRGMLLLAFVLIAVANSVDDWKLPVHIWSDGAGDGHPGKILLAAKTLAESAVKILGASMLLSALLLQLARISGELNIAVPMDRGEITERMVRGRGSRALGSGSRPRSRTQTLA